ncbi:MAG: polysaccharide biosynthesis C-terminal domain-containing protein [Bacteroidales bacterium]|nr:polysaccharide biosynthesis C-terminal domain-containing protein [Bacteroidales bacterium]
MAVHPIKRLAGQTVIYGMSSIVGRLLNYLLVPLYTHLIFETQEYGVVTLMYSYVAFLLVILTYGMETAFFRFYENHPDQRQTVFSTTLFSILFTSTLFILATSFLRQPIAGVLGFADHPEYIAWLGIIVGLDAIAAIPFARLRAENKPVKFALVKFVNIGVNIGLNLFFLLLCPWLLEKGPQGLQSMVSAIYDPAIGVGYVFISNLVASIVTLLLLVPVMLRSQFGFSSGMLHNMLIYSLPLLVAGLAGVINEALDKILLKYLLPQEVALSQVGIYGACYKISIMMTIFIQAFRFAAEPFFFSQAANKDARQLYAQVMKYFVIACLFIFLGIMLFIDIVQYFVGEDYREGLGVVPILLLANMFLGIYFNLSIWYKLTGQTRYGALIALIGALITILLNIWWIPLIGYFGSAWATLVCYVSMTLLSFFWGQKFFRVPYELKTLALFMVAALAVYFVSLLTASWPALAKYSMAFLLLGVFAFLVLLIDRSLMDQFKRTMSIN